MSKIFVGSGKKIEFGNGGSIINASICIDDLLEAAKSYGKKSDGNGKTYIKLKIGSRKETDKFGNTHSVEIDTWTPDSQQQGGNFSINQNAGQNTPAQQETNFDDKIPF